MRDRIVDDNLIKTSLFPMLSISEILEWSIHINCGVLKFVRITCLLRCPELTELCSLPSVINMSGSSQLKLLAQPISQGKSMSISWLI